VQADQHAVACEAEVLLDEVRALLEREPVAGQRMLGRIGGRAAVCDEDLPVCGLKRDECGQDGDERRRDQARRLHV